MQQQPARRRRVVQVQAAAPANLVGQQPQQQQPQQALRGREVVLAFYEAYNRRDLDAIATLISDTIIYSDLVYEEPHEGRAGVMEWLEKIRQYAPDDLKFVIEDMTDGTDNKVGVMWHVECGEGIVFPFSRGCSFITLTEDGGQIQTVRDIVEPSIKPGDTTLQLLGTLTPLIRQLGPGGADPARLKRLPVASAAVWAFYAGYLAIVLCSPWVPGPPAWATQPEVFSELFNESINLWWINEALLGVGLSPIHTAASHPVSEATFNVVIAWAALFLPAILTDGPSRKVANKELWFTGIAFITNVFFIPFMALRALPEPLQEQQQQQPAAVGVGGAGALAAQQASVRPRRVPVPGSQRLPGWSPVLGGLGMFMGALCIYWGLAGRPELGGDLAARWEYMQTTLATNRVFWAFWFDMVLFYVWQLSFMQAAPGYKYVPYFGLAAWLLAGGTRNGSDGGAEDAS